MYGSHARSSTPPRYHSQISRSTRAAAEVLKEFNRLLTRGSRADGVPTSPGVVTECQSVPNPFPRNR